MGKSHLVLFESSVQTKDSLRNNGNDSTCTQSLTAVHTEAGYHKKTLPFPWQHNITTNPPKHSTPPVRGFLERNMTSATSVCDSGYDSVSIISSHTCQAAVPKTQSCPSANVCQVSCGYLWECLQILNRWNPVQSADVCGKTVQLHLKSLVWT